MPFASFKNIQKRNARLHKERSQPEARKKFGALPKKKDFLLRSRDDESKRSRVQELKRKTLMKNDDEFYFAMNNSTFSDEKGHIPLNDTKQYSDSQLAEMLSRDILFLRRELQIEKSKINDLESRLNLLPADPSVTNRRLGPKRTIFVESIEEARKVKASYDAPSAASHFSSNLGANDAATLQSLQAASYKELSERLGRAEKLQLVIQKREAKDKIMKTRGVKHKVECKSTPNHPAVYKFEHKRYK